MTHYKACTPHQGSNVELGKNEEAKYVSLITKGPAPVKARVRGRERRL